MKFTIHNESDARLGIIIEPESILYYLAPRDSLTIVGEGDGLEFEARDFVEDDGQRFTAIWPIRGELQFFIGDRSLLELI